MQHEKQKRVARNALALMERVSMQGKEVSAFIEINELIGKIAKGELVAVSPDVLRPQAAQKPEDVDEENVVLDQQGDADPAA